MALPPNHNMDDDRKQQAEPTITLDIIIII